MTRYKIYGNQMLELQGNLSYSKDYLLFEDSEMDIMIHLCQELEKQGAISKNESEYIQFYANPDIFNHILNILNQKNSKKVILNKLNSITDFDNLDIVPNSFELDDISIIDGMIHKISFVFLINKDFNINFNEKIKLLKNKFNFFNVKNISFDFEVFLHCKEKLFIEQHIDLSGNFTPEIVQKVLDIKNSNFKINYMNDKIKLNGYSYIKKEDF